MRVVCVVWFGAFSSCFRSRSASCAALPGSAPISNPCVRVLEVMAGCVCLVVLKDGQRKKVSLPNGAYGELMDALASLTNIHDKTLVSFNQTFVSCLVPISREMYYMHT